MLEQALETNSDPAETARAFMNYMAQELPVGGQDSEYRFCQKLFPLLVSRVFGFLDTNPNPAEGDPHQQQQQHLLLFHHMCGGWLSRDKRWNYYGNARPTPSASGSSTRHPVQGSTNTTSISNDPVVQLLSPPPMAGPTTAIKGKMAARVAGALSQARSGTGAATAPLASSKGPTMLTLLCQENESSLRSALQYQFPFKALPESCQQLLVKLIESNLLSGPGSASSQQQQQLHRSGAHAALQLQVQATDNEVQLFESLFTTKPMQQNSVVNLCRETLKVQHQQQQMHNMPQHQQHQFTYSPHNRHGHGPMMSPTGTTMGSPSAMNQSPRHMNMNMGSPSFQMQQQQQQAQQGQGGQSPAMNRDELLLKQASDCRVMLSMMEFYIIFFLRYPWAKPTPPTSAAQSSQSSSSRASARNAAGIYGGPSYSTTTTNRYATAAVTEPYGETVYLHLFRLYVQYFLRRTQDPASTGYNTSNNSDSHQPRVTSKASSTNSELFLRVLIAFWLNGRNLPLSNCVLMEKRKSYSRGHFFANNNGHSSSPSPGEGMVTAFDVIELVQDYKACPSLITRSLQYLVNHLCSDAALNQNMRHLQAADGGINLDDYRFVGSDNSSSGVNDPFLILTSMTLTPFLGTMQQPLWNYLRVTLKYASFTAINRAGDSHFSRAVMLWITWLEPWNSFPTPRSATTGGGAKDRFLNTMASAATLGNATATTRFVPKPNSPSKYSEMWAPYVAANAHFYGVLLAIFVRRARDLDFSFRAGAGISGKNAFDKSLALVQRVLRVYTPEVVTVANRCLSTIAVNVTVEGDGGSTEGGETIMASNLERQLKLQHDQVLGDFCPVGPMKTHDVADDMYALLEEMASHLQKKKDSMDRFDKLEDWINSTSGNGGTKQEGQAIDVVKTRAGVIAGFPKDFQIIMTSEQQSSSKKGSPESGVSADSRYKPDTTADGFLTDKGREQLRTGAKVLRPQDVPYLGDRMFGRVKSYEIGCLVSWSVWLSLWLNIVAFHTIPESYKKDVLSKDVRYDGPFFIKMTQHKDFMKHRRWWVNLRFCAEYKTLIWFGVISSFFKLVRIILY